MKFGRDGRLLSRRLDRTLTARWGGRREPSAEETQGDVGAIPQRVQRVTAGNGQGSDAASPPGAGDSVSGTSSEALGTGEGTAEPRPDGNAATGPVTRAAFLSVRQFAVVVGVSEKTVLRRIRDGGVRATRIGRLWRIPVTEVGRLLG